MTDYSWCNTIKKGDVLVSPSGMLRIVREVLIQREHTKVPRIILTFTIQKCSWTHRCYTGYPARELARNGYRPTGLRQKLGTEFDRAIEQEIQHGVGALRCCDVRGLW